LANQFKKDKKKKQTNDPEQTQILSHRAHLNLRSTMVVIYPTTVAATLH
jgi:hypothetical protein